MDRPVPTLTPPSVEPDAVGNEYDAAGVNVNTPVPLLYDSEPAPLAEAVLTDKLPNVI